jgi:trk system potassium uptake protein TrkH
MFSVACMLAYRWVGMSWADAFMHMCTTMGLGGFSSHDASFGFWPDKNVEVVAIVFMSLAGISFARYFIVWRARSFWSLLRDAEVRTYGLVLLCSAIGLTGLLMLHGNFDKLSDAALSATFHVVSLATTTGYAATDYATWPIIAPIWLMFLGTFVSCAGSTGGGIKMVRMVVLVKQARRELVRAVHPRIVNPVTMGRATIPATVIATVMAYMLIYGATTLGLTMLMLLSGMDIVTAFSAVVATVNNIGPGLGQVGPSTNFSILSDFQTWVGTLGMLMGRLELLAVMVLFVPEFWRK